MARAWSGTFDDLIGNVIDTYLSKNVPMDLPGLAPYPDFFSALLIMILAGKLVQKSDVGNQSKSLCTLRIQLIVINFDKNVICILVKR